jgi:hypothetical protein
MSSASRESKNSPTRLRHDLKPLLLGLRAAQKLLETKKVQDAREILAECEKKLEQILAQLAAPGKDA